MRAVDAMYVAHAHSCPFGFVARCSSEEVLGYCCASCHACSQLCLATTTRAAATTTRVVTTTTKAASKTTTLPGDYSEANGGGAAAVPSVALQWACAGAGVAYVLARWRR